MKPFDARQSEVRSALSGIGTSANTTVDLVFAAINTIFTNRTGTAGNIVFSISPTLTGQVIIGGVADPGSAKTNLQIQGSTTGYTNAIGLEINAGTSVNDYALLITNASAAQTIFRINGLGNAGLGALGQDPSVAFQVSNTKFTAAGGFETGIYSEPVFTAGATNAGICFRTNLTTAASAFTMALGADYQAGSAVIGAGSSVTNHVAFLAQATGGGNIAQFADNGTFSGNYFINQSGTVQSSLGGSLTVLGQMGVGGAAGTGIGINWAGQNLSGINQIGVYSSGLFTGSTSGVGIYSNSGAAAGASIANYYGMYIGNAFKGAGATVTSQTGLHIESMTSGGTNFAITTGTGTVSFGDILQLKGSSSGAINFLVPSAITNYNLEYPATQGGSGTVLQNDGSGNFSWASVATNPMTTLGDIIYGGTSGTATRLPGNASTTFKVLSQTGTGSVSAAPVWSTFPSGKPNIIRLTTPGTGTYTTSAGVNWIRVKVLGAGGGGGGSGTTNNAGVNGSASFFDTSVGIQANGGTGGGGGQSPANGGAGGAGGGIVTGGVGTLVVAMTGNAGGSANTGSINSSGAGGAGVFGGGGMSAVTGVGTGGSAATNSGAGGGGGAPTTSVTGGGGGGAGGYIEIVSGPLSGITYQVGSHGAGGAGSTNNGGLGGDGLIIIEEYFY